MLKDIHPKKSVFEYSKITNYICTGTNQSQFKALENFKGRI